MSAVESLAQTRAGQRQLRLVKALTELEPLDSSYQVAVRPLRENSEKWGLEAGAITSDLKYLQSLGLVHCFESVAGINNVFIQQPGLDLAREYQELLKNHRRRTQEIRDDILNWLYDEHISGGHVLSITDFLCSPRNHFLGDPYTQQELSRAARWLVEEEYIDGFKTLGAELLRPSIATKGMRVIEAEQSVNKALSSAGVPVTQVTISDSQGVNVAVGSSNVTQSNMLTQGQIEQVNKMLGSVRALLNPHFLGASEESVAQAQEIAREIEDEIKSPAPQPSKIKALGFKLLELTATGTVQGAVDAVNTVVQQGLTQIT